MRNTLEYNNIPIYWEHFCFEKMRRRKLYCALCHLVIKAQENCFFILNNFKLFPNVFVHQSCVESNIPTEKDIERLKVSYEEAKKHYEIGTQYWFKQEVE